MFRLLLFSLLMAVCTCTLFAQPANDDCVNAIEIGIDTSVTFTTIGATNVGPVVEGCGGFTPATNDSIPADIWYTYTATEDAVMSWSNCGTGVFDSRMAVYQGSDPCAITNDDLVNCNDDGNGCADLESELIFVVMKDSTYILRLGGYGGEDTPVATGSGTVLLTSVNVPLNDMCANAIPIQLGEGQMYTTVNAITDGPDHSNTNPCFQFGSLTVGQDIWYTYTPDFTGTVEWVNCGDINYDSRMAVYRPGSPCPPAPDDLYGCNDDGPDCPFESFHSDLFFEVEAGMTYLLRLGGYGPETGIGSFDLINNSPPEPPANDDCANAIETFILTPAEADDFVDAQIGTTIGATFAEENFIDPPCLEAEGFNPGGLWGDVWYTVQTQGNDSLQMRLFPDGDTPETDFFMDVLANCTDTLATPIGGTCFRVDDEELLGRTSTITGLPSGENITIYVRVSSRLTTQAPGGFGFQLVGDISTGTENRLAAENLKLYPNPARDQVTVDLTLGGPERLHAKVFDLLGRPVISRELGEFSGGNQRFTLNTSKLLPGVYSVRIDNGRASKSLKFVIR